MGTSAISEKEHVAPSVSSAHKYVVPIIGFILGVFTLVSLFVLALPPALKGWAESQLTNALAHRVEIKNLNLNILSGRVELEGLRISSNENHTELLVVRQVNIDSDVLPLFTHKVVLHHLEIVSPVVHLIRTEDSLWNVPTIGKRDSSSDSKTSISFTIQNAVLRDGSLTIEDRSLSPRRTEQFNDIELTLHDISPASSNPAKIRGSALVSDSGTIMIDGAVFPNFRSGNLNVHLTDIALTPLQGVFSDHLRVQGRVTARLTVTWPGKDDSPFRISGDLDGHDITLLSAGLPMGHATTVSASKVEVIWPTRVAVDRLLLNRPEFWIRRNESGRFVGFRTGEDSTQPASASRSHDDPVDSAPSSTQWHIGKILARGGTVHLEDRSVSPPYSDVLHHLEMTLEDFMPASDHAMGVTARADLASGGALDIHGQAAFFGSSPSVALKASVLRFVVPTTNSYLKRTVSHYTTDGTLTTVMDIRLNAGTLDVRTDVTLSDLEVEPVQNATHRTVQERIGLPLRLLIALLKDDSGRIVITFPISGPLSNPTFDWTNAIWATIRNAIVKLVTLPIRSIGWFVTGTHQADELPLEPIIFEAGSATIRQDMDRKLHDLAKLLRSTNRAVLHMTPILSAADIEALRRLPPQSWPIPSIDTAETAGHVLAVRRAYLVATRLAGLAKVSSERLPVTSPKPDTSEGGRPRVKLQLEKAGDARSMGRASSTGGGES